MCYCVSLATPGGQTVQHHVPWVALHVLLSEWSSHKRASAELYRVLKLLDGEKPADSGPEGLKPGSGRVLAAAHQVVAAARIRHTLWSCCSLRPEPLCRCSDRHWSWSGRRTACRGQRSEVRNSLLSLSQCPQLDTTQYCSLLVFTSEGVYRRSACSCSTAEILPVWPDQRTPSPGTDQYPSQTCSTHTELQRHTHKQTLKKCVWLTEVRLQVTDFSPAWNGS